MKSIPEEFRYPRIRLDILLTELNKLYENNNDRFFTKDKMAQDIEASRISSSIPAKIFELKNFGLLEGDFQHLHITELGRKIFQVGDSQRQIDLEKAIRNIKLYDTILNIGGKNFTDEKLLNILIKNGQLTEKDAKQYLNGIRGAFLRDIDCILHFKPKTTLISKELKFEVKTVQVPTMEKSQDTTPSHKNEETPKNRHEIPEMSIKYGTHNITIIDELTFRFAQQMMLSIRKELKRRGVEFDTE